MNAERPSPHKGDRVATAAKQTTRIARPTDSDARLAGELASARVAAAGEVLVLDRTPCVGRCFTFGVAELRHIGERYGACPCSLGDDDRDPS